MIPPGIPAGKSAPSSGFGSVGQPSCSRISSASPAPAPAITRPVRMYWMPITLWSVLKTYRRRKLGDSDIYDSCSCSQRSNPASDTTLKKPCIR